MLVRRDLGQHIGDLAAGDQHVRPGTEPRAYPLEQLRRMRRQPLAFALAAGRIEQVVQIALPARQSGEVAQHHRHRVALVAAAFDIIASHGKATLRRPAQRVRAPGEGQFGMRRLLRGHRRDKTRIAQEAVGVAEGDEIVRYEPRPARIADPDGAGHQGAQGRQAFRALLQAPEQTRNMQPARGGFIGHRSLLWISSAEAACPR